MTKSTITREQVIALIAEHSYDSALVDALEHLLAAMDSESGCLPLDYLQGHKDGLEWAARLAEANHPDTGDWLYDDPIELAKAIRKGPDMPPAQPVEDSEPDRNPVLAYADSYRDMAKQGVESVPIWSVITDLERNIAPLYRHAQQPVVDADDNFYSWFGREWQENYQHNQYTTAVKRMLGVMAESAWKAGHRAAMLQAGNSPAIPGAEKRISDAVELLKKAAPAMLADNSGPDGPLAGRVNSPVIPDGLASMLRRWLAFGRGMQNAGCQLPRNLIAETEEMLAAAPQEVK